MTTCIPDALRREVVERAKQRCEYCLIQQSQRLFAHEIDHIIAEKHGGDTRSENLSLACSECNRFKGSGLCSFDTITQTIVPLFNPRSEVWGGHFRIVDGVIEALTPTGRVTARLLQFNRIETIERRRSLQRLGRYPDE